MFSETGGLALPNALDNHDYMNGMLRFTPTQLHFGLRVHSLVYKDIGRDEYLPWMAKIQILGGGHRRENVPRTENTLGTWPAELKVDLKRSQTGPQHDIRMCFVAYWTPLFHSVRPNG